MKIPSPFLTLLFTCCLITFSFSQTTLLYEGFESCIFPTDWSSTLTGNEDAAWYVGLPQNSNADGSTIDGGCMLIMDDDATGDDTPAWKLVLQTPFFDGRGFTSLKLNVDVHYRHAGDEASLQIEAFDGNTYHPLKLYQLYDSQTGEQFSEFVTFSADLSFFAHENMAIRFTYDDGNSWAWWAGIDNVHVIGEGTATNLILENFDACLPGAWTTQVLQGENDWQFGRMDNPEAWAGNSLNGSCFAFFDDDIIGEEAPPSVVRLMSPVFDGATFANYDLSFDVLYRQAVEQEAFAIGVIDPVSGEERIVKTYTSSLGDEQLPNYIQEQVSLTAFRSAQMQFFFQYNDGGAWGWWLALDNIKLSADGFTNDLCDQALPIFVDSTCVTANNLTALYSAPDSDCGDGQLGGLWFRLEATATQLLRLTTAADFNDVVNIYSGNCEGLNSLVCTNRDEHGFTGEQLYFDVEAGLTYYVLVSGIKSEFGRARGSFCLDLQEADTRPLSPSNDLCANATPLVIDQDCVIGSNKHAEMDGPIPLKNPLSRASIWYSFTPTSMDALRLETAANFSDVITLFEGSCEALTEVASTEFGQSLVVDELIPNQPYHVQVSNLFATLEGEVCMQLATEETIAPNNDNCINAVMVAVDGSCLEGTNVGANYEGPSPSCDLFLSAGIWYQFVAPESRSVWLKTNASFHHNVSVFSGDCEGLKEVYCGQNPISCEGYTRIEQLIPGQIYHIRLASIAGGLGEAVEGSTCLEILDGLNAPPVAPLGLSVQVDCLPEGMAKLQIQGTGGVGAYAFQGNNSNDLLSVGDTYLVVLSDGAGCEQAVTGQVSCTAAACNINSSISFNNASCADQPDGIAQIIAPDADSSYAYEWSHGATGTLANNLLPGTYSVTISTGESCQSVSFVNIGPAAINMSIEQVSDESSLGQDGAIDVQISGGTPPYSYFWMSGGQAIGTSEDLAGLSGGNYTLQVTDAKGCTFVSETINVGSLVASADLEDSSFIEVQPNPNSGNFLLSIQLTQQENVQIEISDAAGQVIQRFPSVLLLKEAVAINLRGQAAGLYLVNVRIGTKKITKRVIVI